MSVAWVGAGIAVAGAGLSYKSSKDATKAGKKAAGSQLEFEQQKYDEWQSTYGALEDNLSEYYNSLSADSYAAMGLENSQQAFETSMSRINESLAQRGITNAAVGASLEAQAELGHAEERAKIRSDAPRAVAQDKTSFLQIGLGQNPSASMSQTLAQQSQTLQQQANIQEQAAGQAIGAAVSSTGKAVGDYLAKPESSLPDYNPEGSNMSPIEQPWES